MLIRMALKEDLQEVLEVEQRAFVPGIRAETIGLFRDQLDIFPQGFLVMEEEGRVVGYITGQLIWKGDNLYSPDVLIKDRLHRPSTKPDYLYITSLACDRKPNVQRGFQLASMLIERFDELPCLGIVNANWPRAIKMWERLGFKHENTLVNFFHPKDISVSENGLVFIRSIRAK